MNVPYETLEIDPNEIAVLTAKMKGCKYKLGAKASFDQQLADIKEIDCSGYFRLLVHKACGEVIPDGTYAQHRYFKNGHFKPTSGDYCKLHDGVLRVCVMTPAMNGQAWGHIAFVLNGRTYESYGGNGPGSRAFTGTSKFQRIADKFVIAYP